MLGIIDDGDAPPPLPYALLFFPLSHDRAFSAECTQFGAPFYIPLRLGGSVVRELNGDSPYAAAQRYLCS
ncbi:MAG TPA: hypothetical protein VF852_17330, partial [Pseudolabrys sp.]